MSCLVVIELPENKRLSITYLDEDFKTIDKIWFKTDAILVALKRDDHFQASTWDAMNIDEWHIMLVYALKKYLSNISTNSNDFNIIMTGFLKHLNTNNKQVVNYVHIHHKGDDEYLIQTNALTNLKAGYESTPPKLKLVVDNGH